MTIKVWNIQECESLLLNLSGGLEIFYKQDWNKHAHTYQIKHHLLFAF